MKNLEMRAKEVGWLEEVSRLEEVSWQIAAHQADLLQRYNQILKVLC